MRPAFVYLVAALTALIGLGLMAAARWLDGGFFLLLSASVLLKQRAAVTADVRLQKASRACFALALALLAASFFEALA